MTDSLGDRKILRNVEKEPKRFIGEQDCVWLAPVTEHDR